MSYQPTIGECLQIDPLFNIWRETLIRAAAAGHGGGKPEYIADFSARLADAVVLEAAKRWLAMAEAPGLGQSRNQSPVEGDELDPENHR